MQPAFYHTFEYQRGYRIGVVRLNPVVSERMARDHLKDTLHPRQLPMLVEPEPWTSHNRGGYMYSRSAFFSLLYLLVIQITSSSRHAVQRLPRTTHLHQTSF